MHHAENSESRFCDYLQRVQAKESSSIPDRILHLVTKDAESRRSILHHHIHDSSIEESPHSLAVYGTVKRALFAAKEPNYLRHIPKIVMLLTGALPHHWTLEEEQRLADVYLSMRKKIKLAGMRPKSVGVMLDKVTTVTRITPRCDNDRSFAIRSRRGKLNERDLEWSDFVMRHFSKL